MSPRKRLREAAIPKPPKYPSEFYGTLVSPDSIAAVANTFVFETCPFLRNKCIKIRKSNAIQSIGACSVLYKGASLIACPHRFIQRYQIFLDCVRYLRPNLRYYVVPEITMPGGNIDYCVVALDGASEIVDFVGIEIQALDTTQSGAIWTAREDLSHGVLKHSYKYGINWKMSAKTILVQLHHKAASFQAVNKKLVLVIQKEFYEYMEKVFQTKHLRDVDEADVMQFHIYNNVTLGDEYQIVLDSRKSTDVDGVEKLLKLGVESDILEPEVIERIRAKWHLAVPLVIPKPGEDLPPIMGVSAVDESGKELEDEEDSEEDDFEY